MTHPTPPPFPGPVPDLAQLAQMAQQQRPGFAVNVQCTAAFQITVPYNATPRQRSQAAQTARALLLEFVTGQAPQEAE